jgi:hypothetical protein
VKLFKYKTSKDWLATAVVGMLVAGSANAALTQLQITYDTSYTGAITGGGANNENVYLTAFSATRIGGDPLPSPTPNPFFTFCLDIAPVLIPTDWWKSETFANAGAGNTVAYQAGGIQRAASLYNAYVGDVNFLTGSGKQESAALQLAIWNVLYDTDTTVLGGAGFQVAGADSGVTTLADQMLSSVNNAENPNLTSTFWNATDSNGNPIFNQDLIGPQMETGMVPEPGTYAAAASTCAFLSFLGMRRKQTRS